MRTNLSRMQGRPNQGRIKQDGSSMIDKYESRRIRRETREILLNVWDLIGRSPI